MSARKKAKKSTAGEILFSQFASCVEDGLNIHVCDEESTANSTKSPEVNNSKDDPTKKQPVGKAAANEGSTTTTYPRVECTNGAMEALRQCHSAFLEKVSGSLAELDSTAYSLTETDVMAVMHQMGLSKLADRAVESMSINKKPQKKKRKKPTSGFKGTREELIAEQERLLAESACRVREMNQQTQGKSEE